jgi:hypothetical protein
MNTPSTIVVISLRRRKDRLDGFFARLAAAWPAAVDRVQVVEAVDGELCPAPDWWRGPPGAFGCYRSHHRVIESALVAQVEELLVLEDDVTFCDCFEVRLAGIRHALPDDWGQFYLGGQHLAPPEPVNDLVVRGSNINRTHAYFVRGGEPMRHLYRHLHPGEHWEGKHHVDHHYGRLHRKRWPAYAPREWLCGQAADHSDIKNRPQEERWWQR